MARKSTVRFCLHYRPNSTYANSFQDNKKGKEQTFSERCRQTKGLKNVTERIQPEI